MNIRLLAAIVAGVFIVAPLTYSVQAHQDLDAIARRWSWMGDQTLGFDLTMPRQNIFSLARDLTLSATVVDHAVVRTSHLIGLFNFFTRGSLTTVADALEWFNIPLTVRQTDALSLCTRLDELGDHPIVIRPDPYQRGTASWYGPGFQDRLAASGETYNMYALTAAHKTLPLQSIVRVVNAKTGATVLVRINDRGPYVGGRIIDLSYRAKQFLGMVDLSSVYLERINPAALDVQCP